LNGEQTSIPIPGVIGPLIVHKRIRIWLPRYHIPIVLILHIRLLSIAQNTNDLCHTTALKNAGSDRMCMRNLLEATIGLKHHNGAKLVSVEVKMSRYSNSAVPARSLCN
jgi:hypothetical protein